MICGDCGHDENVHGSKTELCDLYDFETGERCPCKGFCEPDENPQDELPTLEEVRKELGHTPTMGLMTPFGFIPRETPLFDAILEELRNRAEHQYLQYQNEKKNAVKSGSTVPDSLEAWCKIREEKKDGERE